MNRGRLEITSKDLPGAGTTVRFDGVEIQNALRGIRLSMAVDEVTTAELDVLVIDTTEVDTDAQAHIPDETRDLLIKLGWTPPQEP